MSVIKRRKYDSEFKKDAIALSKEPGKTDRDVERSLGIPQGMLYRWKQQLKRDGELAFPGLGREALTVEQREIKELKKQLKDVTLERDILKKAVGIFSKLPK